MIRQNVAGQFLWAQLNSTADGSPLTTGATFNYDGGTYGAGSGTLTHRGGGLWRYALTQAETNVTEFGYQFSHASGVAVGGTVLTTAADPTNATTFGIGNLDAAVSTRSTYAGTDTAGTTTLLARLSATRAGLLDNLDAAVSTRSTYAGGAVASVTGSVGSIAGVTFPTRFSLLAIDTDGRVDVGSVAGEPAGLVTPPLEADVTLVGGSPIPTPAVAGYLPVDIAKVLGADPLTDPSTVVTLAAGTVATGTSATSFTATIAGSTLSSTSGAYTGKQKLIFQSGTLAGQGRPFTSYTVSGGTATLNFTDNPFTAAPGAGDTFVIG